MTGSPGRLRQSIKLAACHREAPAFDDQLRAAIGFRVLGPSGALGTVEGHEYTEFGTLCGLTVRSGLFRPQRFRLPVDEIEWVLPRGRLLLTHDPGGAA